ncbi:MAG: CO dehydrogenase/acetyl-CoA synthase subunit delta [Candidatus Altiarchaeota archaeon]|nr:CO dehydrogenase/acetyl-CoA synthase subunit delta [Candidatus Altiarchaeota archaeon]
MNEKIQELKKLLGESDELEIENLELEVDELVLNLRTRVLAEAIKQKRKKIEAFRFTPPSEEYKGRISEVTLGATKADGGTRSHSLTIGGETSPPYYFFESKQVNKPVISQDIFDMPLSLPGHVREHFPDVMEDPAEWARYRVKKYNAEMITLHMVSTDPTVKDVSVKDACKIIEDVLQAVKVPIVIGGSGNPRKDPELLEKAAEICSGEKIILSTVDPDMDYKRVAKAALKHDHSVLSLISMNPDEMRRLNRNLMKQGLTPEHMLMDLFTGGIGYGLEYSISAMERCRLAGLKGDKNLGLPMVSATSNAWSAREAWMRNDAWGPREWRGPLWESTTAAIALLSGANLFMMLHPKSIETMNGIIDSLSTLKDIDETKETNYPEWINI